MEESGSIGLSVTDLIKYADWRPAAPDFRNMDLLLKIK
jgi:hypothetical protein